MDPFLHVRVSTSNAHLSWFRCCTSPISMCKSASEMEQKDWQTGRLAVVYFREVSWDPSWPELGLWMALRDKTCLDSHLVLYPVVVQWFVLLVFTCLSLEMSNPYFSEVAVLRPSCFDGPVCWTYVCATHVTFGLVHYWIGFATLCGICWYTMAYTYVYIRICMYRYYEHCLASWTS